MISLTERDQEILETLTRKIRFLSVAQIARTWWRGSSNAEANARARLKILERADFVARFTAITHPEIELSAPVLIWEPGNPTPDLGSASWRLKSRWNLAPATTPAVIATAGSGHRFGGTGGRFPRGTEQTHDLHLAALYLNFRADRPELAKFWVSEEALRPEMRGEGKLPDAMIRTADYERVIEFGGAYGKAKLEEFHRFCSARGLAYELW